MKNIPLPKGLFTIVDDDDFERCNQFKWWPSDRGYVVRTFRKSDGHKASQRLSRFIMNAPEGIQVDHIHGRLLDNRKSELRFSTHSQNQWNRGKNSNNKSGFKGVSWDNRASKWRAQIMTNRKTIHIGLFDDINDASSAYASAAKKYHGEFSRT